TIAKSCQAIGGNDVHATSCHSVARPPRPYPPAGRWPAGGLPLVEHLVVLAIIVVLPSPLLPPLQSARQAATPPACQNNLKNLALAFHNYETTEKHLPFCKRVESDGAARSWVPDLLPYLEQENMVSDVHYDLNQDWWRIHSEYVEDPANPGSFVPDPS